MMHTRVSGNLLEFLIVHSVSDRMLTSTFTALRTIRSPLVLPQGGTVFGLHKIYIAGGNSLLLPPSLSFGD